MNEQYLVAEHIVIPEEDHERVQLILQKVELLFREQIREIFAQPLAESNTDVVELVARLEAMDENKQNLPVLTQRTIVLNTQTNMLSILLAPKEEVEVYYN